MIEKELQNLLKVIREPFYVVVGTTIYYVKINGSITKRRKKDEC